MARKEHFRYRQTEPLLKTLDEAAQGAGVSRPQAFEDFLTICICTYRTGLKDLVSRQSGGDGFRDDEYMKTIEPYSAGNAPRRPLDRLKHLFHTIQELVAMDDLDVLGDLFESSITFGEHGQYFSPDSLCELLARMTGPGGKTVYDPAGGSGRMLLAAARVNRNREFISHDKDHRCGKIAAINLAMRNLYGYSIVGNTLASDPAVMYRHIYRTGYDGSSWIRDVTYCQFRDKLAVLDQQPAQVVEIPDDVNRDVQSALGGSDLTDEPPRENRPSGQLRLF